VPADLLAADRFVRAQPSVTVLPGRGFATDETTFAHWAQSQRGLLLENFYRDARRRFDVLMEGAQPAGSRWNFDADNREPPPKGSPGLDVSDPWLPEEDDIDEQVRADLNRWERGGLVSFVGRDGPRECAVTRAEALSAFEVFLRGRLALFGPYEDAMLASAAGCHTACYLPQ